MEESSQHKLFKWRESAKATLCRFQAHSEPAAISNLPEELREQNKNVYIPKAINIGPRFPGTRRSLLKLEETKWHYMQSLLHRGPKGPETNLEECKQVVMELENEVRASYGEDDLKLEWKDLANIMLSDSCFLLELLISESEHLNQRLNVRVPLCPKPQVIKKEMLTDMLVLENQIPLLVLHKLSEKLFDGKAYFVPIESLALNLFGYFPNRSFKYFTPNVASHNFLELVHSYISDDSYDQETVLEQAQEGDHSIITINSSTKLLHEQAHHDGDPQVSIKLLQAANQYAKNCASSSGTNNGCAKCVSCTFNVKRCSNCASNFNIKHCYSSNCASNFNIKHCFSSCDSIFKTNGGCCGACSCASGLVPFTCDDCPSLDANADFDSMNGNKAKNIGPLNFRVEFNRCAPILEAAGVKIQMSNPESDHCQPAVISGFKFDIKFNKGTLEIPQLHITNSTQVTWQNLIAWEQCHTGLSYKHKCTWAAFFFNGLICCGSDVQLLKDRKVIMDHLNMSNQELMEFFRSLINGVDRDRTNDSPYWKMVSELNSYYGKCCLRIKRYSIMLRHSWIPMIARQFDRIVLRGYNLLIGMISVYALMQTIYTILGYYHPKESYVVTPPPMRSMKIH